MADDNNNGIEYDFSLSKDSIKKSFGDVEKAADDSGKKIGDSLTKGASTAGAGIAKVAGVLAGLAGGILSFNFLKDAVKQAADAELAVNQLAGAFRNQGLSVKENLKSFTDYSETLEKTVGVDADLINQNAALLVSLGKLSGDGLKNATKAALDLAAGTGKDVNEAFALMTKAATGSTAALGKLGIKVSEAIAPHQRLAEAVKLIEQKFEGFAEAKTNTFSGALTLVELAMDNVSKAIGRLVTQSPVVREVLKFVAEAFGKLEESITGLAKGGGDPIGELLKKLINIGVIISQYVLPPVEIFVRVMIAGFDAVVYAANGVIHALATIGAAIYDFVIKPVLDGLIKSVGAFVGLFNKELGDKINTVGVGITKGISDVADTAAKSSGEVFLDSFNTMVEASKQGFDTTMSQNAETFLTNLQNVANNAKPILDNFKDANVKAAADSGLAWQQYSYSIGESLTNMVQGFKEAAFKLAGSKESMAKAFKDIGASALSGLAGAVGSAFAAFGKALKNGEDAASAFANAFLGAIGGMLVQLGTSYILQGIAASANPLTPGIGGPLIAAGAALATFGGVLQAIGGSSGGAGGGGGASGGGDSGGGVNPTPGGDIGTITQPEDKVPEKPKTSVAVNVYGNVLDNRQTGLALAEVLQDTFDSQGLQVKTNGGFS